jgi:hypothetical protein
MIKANELKIGNKLQKSNEEIFTVLRLDNTQDILVEEQRGLLTLDYNLFGISLTEEWLLKFGFEKIGTKLYLLNNTCFYLQINKILAYPDNWSITLYRNESKICDRLKYVHQLQNLYFALTGEELQLLK